MLRSFGSAIAALVAGMLLSAAASAAVIDTTVPGSTNLYFDDWGHPYNVSGGGNHNDALGRGDAPSAVGYAFSAGELVDITATGCVVDAGSACTGPDGTGGTWRGLPVYALIGIWSTSSTEIDPVEAGANPAFFIGSSASLIVPDYAGDVYLFMAENNGVFVDNHSGEYLVHIETTLVSAPSALLLFAGLGGFLRLRRRQTA